MRAKRASDPAYRKAGATYSRMWQRLNPVKNALNQYRASSKKRGYEFSLSKDEFEVLIQKPCVYCGTEPSPVNGVDRVDNSVGYVPDNCVPCCGTCNKAKGTMTRGQFVDWIIKAYRNIN